MTAPFRGILCSASAAERLIAVRVAQRAAGLASMLAVATSSFIAVGSIARAETTESVAAADPVGVATTVDGPDQNNVVTITVPIDLVPGSPDLARKAKKLARTWESQAETGWNNAFEFFQYKCFTLRLDVDIKVRPVDFAGSEDRHRVDVALGGGGVPGFKGTNERNPSSGSKDGTRSFDEARDGTWREDQTEVATLHEVGHLFGLGDDYDVVVDPNTGEPVEPRRTKPKRGRAGTLMGDGGFIDQALVDRIGKQIEKLVDDLPACEVWKGTLEGTATGACKNLGIDVGFTTYAGSLQIVVDENGKVRGTFEIITTNVCEGNTDTLSSGKQQLVAEKNERRFKIPALNSGRPLVLAITGTHASGTWTDPGGLSGSVTFQLDCKSCSRG